MWCTFLECEGLTNIADNPHTPHHTQSSFFCRLYSLCPHTPRTYTTPTGCFFVCYIPYSRTHSQGFLSAMFLLTPHTLGKYTIPQGSFLLVTLLNPSHPWKVHHTHRAFKLSCMRGKHSNSAKGQARSRKKSPDFLKCFP